MLNFFGGLNLFAIPSGPSSSSPEETGAAALQPAVGALPEESAIELTEEPSQKGKGYETTVKLEDNKIIVQTKFMDENGTQTAVKTRTFNIKMGGMAVTDGEAARGVLAKVLAAFENEGLDKTWAEQAKKGKSGFKDKSVSLFITGQSGDVLIKRTDKTSKFFKSNKDWSFPAAVADAKVRGLLQSMPRISNPYLPTEPSAAQTSAIAGSQQVSVPPHLLGPIAQADSQVAAQAEEVAAVAGQNLHPDNEARQPHPPPGAPPDAPEAPPAPIQLPKAVADNKPPLLKFDASMLQTRRANLKKAGSQPAVAAPKPEAAAPQAAAAAANTVTLTLPASVQKTADVVESIAKQPMTTAQGRAATLARFSKPKRPKEASAEPKTAEQIQSMKPMDILKQRRALEAEKTHAKDASLEGISVPFPVDTAKKDLRAMDAPSKLLGDCADYLGVGDKKAEAMLGDIISEFRKIPEDGKRNKFIDQLAILYEDTIDDIVGDRVDKLMIQLKRWGNPKNPGPPVAQKAAAAEPIKTEAEVEFVVDPTLGEAHPVGVFKLPSSFPDLKNVGKPATEVHPSVAAPRHPEVSFYELHEQFQQSFKENNLQNAYAILTQLSPSARLLVYEKLGEKKLGKLFTKFLQSDFAPAVTTLAMANEALSERAFLKLVPEDEEDLDSIYNDKDLQKVMEHFSGPGDDNDDLFELLDGLAEKAPLQGMLRFIAAADESKASTRKIISAYIKQHSDNLAYQKLAKQLNL